VLLSGAELKAVIDKRFDLAVVEQKLNLYGGNLSVKLVDEKAIGFDISIPLN
jgi:hypothetical protein